MRKLASTIMLTLSIAIPAGASAQAFEECPSAAYLVQGSSGTLYGVNLATGSYELLSDTMGTTGKLNAAGFNVFDNYIYAYSSEFKDIVRFGSDYQVSVMASTNKPNTSFYVGDISPYENAYYVYRPGDSSGLYRVSLDSAAEDYLEYNLIVDGGTLNIAIYDFAFHPSNGSVYAVTRTGDLLRIDASVGSYENLGNVGETGTFGAVYFDSSNYFYISRNSDGNIFRIDLTDPAPTAEFFAFGPSSSNNDGARCVNSSIISDIATIDFGDAPASYGSNIDDNGARHEQTDTLYFGQHWGGDDDGIELVTPFEQSANAVVVVSVKGDGYLNGWADFDQNGTFDNDEQIVTNKAVTTGDNLVLVDIPDDAQSGETWARFRVSSLQDLAPNGGVSDGEVEDYQIEVLNNGVAIESYPGSSSFVSVAYEDGWPVQGDYDMNDVVFALQTKRLTDSQNQVTRYDIEGRLLAYGAGYHNGFAFNLDGIPTQNIDVSKTRLFINGIETETSPLEVNDGADDAVLIISEDLKQVFQLDEGCTYYRTDADCSTLEALGEFQFVLTVSLIEPIPSANAPDKILNPFIFATPFYYHGDDFAQPPGRALEIHLKNGKPSARFNTEFWGLGDDASSDANQYINANNFPWALEIPTLWHHPMERVSISKAYPDFLEFVTSAGAEKGTWYTSGSSDAEKVIENNFGDQL